MSAAKVIEQVYNAFAKDIDSDDYNMYGFDIIPYELRNEVTEVQAYIRDRETKTLYRITVQKVG